MNKQLNHLHKYKKVNIAGYGKPEFLVYKCMKPTCTHYIQMKLAEGKICECNICYEPMLITKKVLHASGGKPLTKPHCEECTKKLKDGTTTAKIKAITEFLSKTGVE